MRKPTGRMTGVGVLIGLAVLLISFLAWQARDRVSYRYRGDNLNVTVLSVAFANIGIVERGGKTIMIDAGNPGHEKRIEKLLAEAGYDPDTIDYLVLTHGHPDHAGSARYFQSRYAIEIIAHTGDRKLFAQSFPGDLCPTSAIARVLKFLVRNQAIEPFEPDIPIDGAFNLAQLGLAGKIIPLPGHTPGSVIIQVAQFAFVGDVVAGNPVAPGAAMTHFFMCDLAENKRRIEALLSYDDITLWFPGHFGALQPEAVQAYVEGR